MLINLLACLAITLFCSGCGGVLLRLLRNLDAGLEIPPALLPFFGLVPVAIFTGIASLFIPLGLPMLQCAVLIGAAIQAFVLTGKKNGISFINPLQLERPFYLLWVCSVLTLLIISTARVNHPDTLAYHAQTIRWINDYPVIRGLAHLNPRLGYQGIWYQLCSFFSFRILGTPELSFLPLCFSFWCCGFLVQQAAKAAQRPESGQLAVFWLLLLGWSFFDFNALRLTASSAGNDFVAASFAWLTFYLTAQKSSVPGRMVAPAFALMAVCIKLSAAPVLLLPVFSLLRARHHKPAFAIFCFGAFLLLVPLAARNVLTTGYPFYPSPLFAWSPVDWQLSQQTVIDEMHYITAWARHPGVQKGPEVIEVLRQPMVVWMPHWWAARNLAEQCLLVTTVLALAAVPFIFRKRQGKLHSLLLFALIGTLSWWMQAPDPRFGMSFTIPLAGFIFQILPVSFPALAKRITGICVVMALMLTGYSTYRVLHFFAPGQLIKPVGIQDAPYDRINCKDQWFFRPKAKKDGEQPVPVPALYISCDSIRLRGTRIKDGFRAP